MTIDKNKQKGITAENQFRCWMDKNQIPYLYIRQETTTFSVSLRKEFLGKRPDFMILLPNLGFIFVDVKYRKINNKHKTYPLDLEETKKYSLLQRKFNMNIWYVISNETYDYGTWFWIPISKALEDGAPKFISNKSKMDFFAVHLSKFIQISSDDSLDRLFSKCFIRKIKRNHT